MTVPRASIAARSVILTEPSEYVEFYLGNMYAWKESGIARILNYLRNWNVDHAHYYFDRDVGWFVVRCLRPDSKYIQNKFVGLQNDIEREVRSLKTSKTTEAPAETFDHPDVEMPTYLPCNMEVISAEGVSDAASSIGHGNGQEISLMVPDSLREFPLVVAWQDLQPRDRVFDPDFISLAAQTKIEQVYKVAIVADEGQKVIFIGGSDAAALRSIKAKLTTLLRDFLSLEQPISYLRHIFFVSQPVHGRWDVEVRDIMNLHPGIRKSTILDPWYFRGRYDCLGQASCLRVCLEDPLRQGPRNALWSVGGPFPKSVLETQKPRHISEAFKDLRVAKRHRVSLPTDDNETDVANWLEGVSELKSVLPEFDAIDSKEPFDPMSGLGEDDPIPLDFERVRIGQASRFDDDEPVTLDYEQFTRRNPQAASRNQEPPFRTGVKDQNILDRDDPILRDPRSALQRPMLPPKREIRVVHPDTLPRINFSSATSQARDIVPGEELEKLISSIQKLLRPMPVRYGRVELRAEMGRFFASKVPASGLSTNSPGTPANGWEAERLREKLSGQAAFFTQALSCFGNDVDLLVKMKNQGTEMAIWKPYSRNVFLDFRFRVPHGTVTSEGVENCWDLVLEVNTKDYSWSIRGWDNECGSACVHCLRQHWDFRVRLSHDRSLEYEEYWGAFAKALIDSLEVSPPKLEFQYLFDAHPVVCNKDLPILVTDVRVRQVCRFRHHHGKTYLDITRMSPTRPTKAGSRISHCTEVATLTKAEAGEFTHWYQAAISSVRLENILRENATLIPGDEASWKAEHLAQEVRDLCEQATSVIQQMDPVGVSCDNGFDEKYWKPIVKKHTRNYKF